MAGTQEGNRGKVVSVGKNAVPAVNPIEALTQIVDCVRGKSRSRNQRKRLSA